MELASTHNTLAKIGYVLLNIQSTERVIKQVIQIAMPHERHFLTSLQEKQSANDIERPLGAFLTELRKRAELHKDVGALLKRFLLRRNVFIHNISQPEGWSLQSDAGLGVIDQQLKELLTDSKDVKVLFLGLLHAWKVQVDIETTKEEDAAFEALAGKYEGGILSRRWGNI